MESGNQPDAAIGSTVGRIAQITDRGLRLRPAGRAENQNAQKNAKESGLEKVSWLEANVFDDLKQRESRSEEFDLIILDPPSFTRNKRSLNDALRGYKEIHLRALKMLQPGGILVSFTCSHHVTRKAFLEMVRDAAVDAKRTLRQVCTYGQRSDHPVNPCIPETEYLHGFAFEIVPAW